MRFCSHHEAESNAVAGDMGSLRSLVAETSEAELQTVLLHSLLSSDADAMEAIAYDPVVLVGLNDWLLALLDDARAFHVVELLLQVSLGFFLSVSIQLSANAYRVAVFLLVGTNAAC